MVTNSFKQNISPRRIRSVVFSVLAIASAVLLSNGLTLAVEYAYNLHPADHRILAVIKLIAIMSSLTLAPIIAMCIPYAQTTRNPNDVEREINVRKRADQMLHQLVEAAPDAIVITNKHGHINMVNRQAERLFARTKLEMTGLSLGDLLTHDSRNQYEHILSFPDTAHAPDDSVPLVEMGIALPDGNTLPVEAGFTSMSTHEGARFCVSIRNISQRKEAIKRIEDMNAELSEKNMDLQQFAYAASHDLQEPLRKIEAFGALLAEDISDRISQQSVDYLHRMISASSRMRTFINDLLTYSRASTVDVIKQPTNLNEIIADVLSDLESRLQETTGSVQVEPLPRIHGNPTQMYQLFLNLLSNAIKFRRDDTSPVISICCSQQNSVTCQIVIQDNGIGFDEKYAERIFGAFQRLHGLHHYEGSGIGLALCRRIVERHGGSIRATSRLAEGAIFTIDMPIAHAKEGLPHAA